MDAKDGRALPLVIMPIDEAFAAGAALEANSPKHGLRRKAIAAALASTHTIGLAAPPTGGHEPMLPEGHPHGSNDGS